MKTTVIISLILVCVLCGCAMQGDVMMLEDRMVALQHRNTELERRILDLEKKRMDLKSQIDEYSQARQQSDQSSRSRYAEMAVNFDKIQEEIRALSGRLEENEHLIRNQMSAGDSDTERNNRLKRLEDGLSSNTDRIARLEQYLNIESSAPDLKNKNDPGAQSKIQTDKEITEDQFYITAKQAFDRGDFATSREEFKEFLTKYPASGRADNAQFWIGETYYLEKWYEKAILEYQNVIEKYPKGNKVQAALLKQGFSFLNLGDKANARLILKELVDKHPQSNEAAIARKKLEAIK
jgi:tol-pal system protein YbgF